MPENRAPSRSHPLSSLATKIILFVFGSTLVSALVVSWISLSSTHDSLRRSISHLYPISLEQTAQRVSAWLDEAQLDVDALAAAAGVGHSRKELDAAVAADRRLAGWIHVDIDGTVHASGAVLPTTAPRCREPGSTPRTCAIPIGNGRAWPGLAATAGDGSLVIGLLSLDEIQALLSVGLPEPESVALLLDPADQILVQTGTAPQPQRAPRRGAGSTGRIEDYEVAGRRQLASARELNGGWSVRVETPFEAAFGPVLEVVTRIFVGDLIVILVASLLAYRVTATVVRPIEKLSDWARRFAEGQDELEVPELTSRDEIGLLARTLTDMRRQLRRRKAELQQANRDLVDRNSRLQQANEVLNQLSITDGLTKLHNHRFFQDHLTREIKRVTRSGEPLSMLLTDIDDFKQLNDRFGHAAGDELLTRIAQILVDSVRDSDLVARYGGEEFVVLALGCDLRAAEALAEKIRTAIAESSFILDDSLRPLRVTVSVGVASFRGNRKRFFQRADEALYRAKSQGKNCVVVEHDDSEPARDPDPDEIPEDPNGLEDDDEL
jgi:diguanylate cyclase (GGDEF)-like protein